MKLRSLRINHQPEFMIIPMIDIMFFLLVFFMLSTLYMVEQRTLPVNLPRAAAAQESTTRTLPVTVTADGRIFVEQDAVAGAHLSQRIATLLQAEPDIAFVLRADKKTDYETVMYVLDEIKLAGARKVALASDMKAR